MLGPRARDPLVDWTDEHLDGIQASRATYDTTHDVHQRMVVATSRP
jgi:hypothetical protein